MQKTVVFSTLVLILTLAVGQPAFGVVTASLVDSLGDPNSTITQPGGSFVVLVDLQTSVNLVSGQFKVHDLSSSGIFTLNSVAFNTPAWSDDPLDFLDPTPETLDAGNSYLSGEIGTIATDLVGGAGSGVIVTINVSVSPSAALGDYELNLVGLTFGQTVSFQEAAAAAGPNYVVSVIPAPGAAVLAMIGLTGATRLRRRTGLA